MSGDEVGKKKPVVSVIIRRTCSANVLLIFVSVFMTHVECFCETLLRLQRLSCYPRLDAVMLTRAYSSSRK